MWAKIAFSSNPLSLPCPTPVRAHLGIPPHQPPPPLVLLRRFSRRPRPAPPPAPAPPRSSPRRGCVGGRRWRGRCGTQRGGGSRRAAHRGRPRPSPRGGRGPCPLCPAPCRPTPRAGGACTCDPTTHTQAQFSAVQLLVLVAPLPQLPPSAPVPLPTPPKRTSRACLGRIP